MFSRKNQGGYYQCHGSYYYVYREELASKRDYDYDYDYYLRVADAVIITVISDYITSLLIGKEEEN